METSNTLLLRQVPVFAHLDEAVLTDLARHSRRRRFRANETLFHKDDPGQTLYLIISGHVNVQTVTPGGEVVHLAMRGPGEHFGELSLIDGKPRMADVVTAEPCDLLMLDQVDFLRCLEASPRAALGIMSSLADRIRQAADRLETQQGLDVLGRVAQTLLELAGPAEGEPDTPGGQRLAIQITQQGLADQIGTTRESVNRALASLKAARAIRTEGRELVILSRRKLRQNCRR